MIYNSQLAFQLLREGCQNPTATFRDGQEEAIRHVCEGLGRLLVIQKTGWGKSFVYFIAAKLLRNADLGPAILISPLLSLMRNQIDAAERMGVCAVTINSDNQAEWSKVKDYLHQNQVDILLISPERLANSRFLSEVLSPIASRISLMVVDEAHCISDWGHDFRPHYRLIERILQTLPPNLRILATTATANARVIADLQSVLGPELTVIRGDLNRPSLLLQTMIMPSQTDRLAWLATALNSIQGSGIIYTLTIRDAQQVAQWLQSRDLAVHAYTSQSGERSGLELALLKNEIKALVATTALGMGFDKPDLAFVIHYQTPGSVIAYYQQVGRAGRALPAAYGVLLSGEEDQEISDYFIENAFPTREEVNAVLEALKSTPHGYTVPELLSSLNLPKGRVEKTLALLNLESPAPVTKQNDLRWQLTAAPLEESFWQRAERLSALRREERKEMQRYAQLSHGHMEFLIRALNGEHQTVTSPPLHPLSPIVDPALTQQAAAFLRRTNVPFGPRKQWPAGGLPKYNVKGPIPEDLQAQPGNALCRWGDAGWGKLVKQGKYTHHRFDDRLVQACVELLRHWNPPPAPTWVCCIPSRNHPHLVPEFAQRLAKALGLPFHAVLVKSEPRPEQKTMANSIQQARNVDGSLDVTPSPIPTGPVLLVDDMVDSRWTLTVGAWLLRRHGSGEVWPLALAIAGAGE